MILKIAIWHYYLRGGARNILTNQTGILRLWGSSFWHYRLRPELSVILQLYIYILHERDSCLFWQTPLPPLFFIYSILFWHLEGIFGCHLLLVCCSWFTVCSFAMNAPEKIRNWHRLNRRNTSIGDSCIQATANHTIDKQGRSRLKAFFDLY